MSIPSPARFLCETCGYDLGRTGATGECPECGTAVHDSRPERRVGSPWQQRPGVVGWTRTGMGLLLHPRSLWSVLRVERPRSLALLLVNTMVVWCLCVVGLLLPSRPAGATFTGAALWSGGLAAMVLVMTWIEHRGIRFFGARREWRVTRPLATAICGHASFAWILTGIGAGLAHRANAAGFTAVPVEWTADMLDRIFALRALGVAPARLILLMLAVAPGLLLFETLVYFGVRRMRFANAEGTTDVTGTSGDPEERRTLERDLTAAPSD